MIDWLKSEWHSLASVYTGDSDLVSKLWEELYKQYTSKTRYYHNTHHIYNMLIQAEDIKGSIADYDTFRFSIWYHDIIYKATQKNNEVKSAILAQKRLQQTHLQEERIETIATLIKSTQKHEIILKKDNDNAFLLDIDLSILGTNWTDYKAYILKIRKEYAIYPDILYKKGRKKAMKHFLERQYIYLTKLYRNRFEEQARRNISREIELL